MAPTIEQESTKKSLQQEILLRWESPSRIFKKRDKEFFVNIGAIIFFLLIILVFAKEIGLIIAILSIVFLVYVLSTVPPENVTHKVTNLGIESAGHFYHWDNLADFWFEEKWKQKLAVVRPMIGPRITLLLGAIEAEDFRKIASEYIPFRDTPQYTWVDNAANWLSNKVPLEKSN